MPLALCLTGGLRPEQASRLGTERKKEDEGKRGKNTKTKIASKTRVVECGAGACHSLASLPLFEASHELSDTTIK
jgi:hypothetical protein